MANSFLKTKLENVVYTDELRPAMCCAYFKDGYVYATNAHVAVKQSLREVHGFTVESIKLLDGKMIHWETLKKLHGHEDYKVTSYGIEAISRFGVKTIFPFHDPDAKFPNIEAIIPSGQEVERPGFGLNASLFKQLSDAMDESSMGLMMTFIQGANGIIVTAGTHSRDEQLGVIMPVMNPDR